MAVVIVKEDGTGLANANSYATLAEAEAYLENTGRSAEGNWLTADTKGKNSALIQATDYLDQIFRTRYKGQQLTSEQRLQWPRCGVYDDRGILVAEADIPEAVGNAAIEYAFEAVGAALAPTPAYDETGRDIKSVREKVDVLETSIVYSGKAPLKFKPYPRAELVIRRWLRFAAGLTARV